MNSDDPIREVFLNPDQHQPLGHVWVSGGVTYLVRCPTCGTENYAMNVTTGICYACGHDANPIPTPQP